MSDTLNLLESRLLDLSNKVDNIIKQENTENSLVSSQDVIAVEQDFIALREKVDLCRLVKAETLGYDSSSVDPDDSIRAIMTAQNLLLYEVNEIFSNKKERSNNRVSVLLRTIEFLGFVVGIRRRYGNSVNVLDELQTKTDDFEIAAELARVSDLVTLKIGKAA